MALSSNLTEPVFVGRSALTPTLPPLQLYIVSEWGHSDLRIENIIAEELV